MHKMNALFAISTMCLIASMPAFANKKKALVCGDKDAVEVVKKMNEKDDDFLDDLKLTADQKRRIAQIQSNHQNKQAELIREIRTVYRDFVSAIERNTAGPEIRQQMNALADKKKDLMAESLDMRLEIRDLLSPEQRREAIAELRDEHIRMCD